MLLCIVYIETNPRRSPSFSPSLNPTCPACPDLVGEHGRPRVPTLSERIPYPLSPFFSRDCALLSATAISQPLIYESFPHSFQRDGGYTPSLCTLSLHSYPWPLSLLECAVPRFPPVTPLECAIPEKVGGGDVLLPDRLLTPGGGSSHGVIHIAVGLFAGITLALVAALKVLKIILENFRASLAQAFSGSLVQCGLGPLLGRTVRMLTELHDSVVSAPIVLILPLALSRHLLFQGVNQEIVGPQNENEPRDPKNGEPLEHGAEPIASPMFSLADYSLRQAASTDRHRRIITKFRLGESAGLMGSQRGGKTFIGGVFVEMEELRGALEQIAGQIAGLIVHPPGRVDEIDFAAGTNHLEGAKPVQDRFDLAQVAFGQHQQEIVFGKAGREIGAATGLLQTPGELFQSRIRCRQAVPFGGLGEIVQVDGSQAQRRILAPRARDLFAELLFDESPRVQARHRIDAGRIENLTGLLRVRVRIFTAQPLSPAAEEPFTIKHPAIEKQKQAQNGPASLIGTHFVKMLVMPEQGRKRGEHEGHCRKCGDEKCGQPKPPLAPRELPQGGLHLLCAESVRSLKRRGIGFAGAET